MKKKLFSLFAITLMLAAAGVVAAQEEAPEPEPESAKEKIQETAEKVREGIREATVDEDVQGTMSVKGKAINASPEEIIIETEDGREVFLVESENLYSEPIAEGTPVEVWFVERADRYYATKLEVAEGDFGSGARLPQTSSSQPLLALLGLIALAGATTVWRLQR